MNLLRIVLFVLTLCSNMGNLNGNSMSTIIDNNAFVRNRITEETRNQNEIIDAILKQQAQEDANTLADDTIPANDDSLSGELDEAFDQIQKSGPIGPVHTQVYGEFGKERSVISFELLTKGAETIEKINTLLKNIKLTKNHENYSHFKKIIENIFKRLEELKNGDFTPENENEIEQLKTKLVDAFKKFDEHYKILPL
jgi:hypothetical protein